MLIHDVEHDLCTYMYPTATVAGVTVVAGGAWTPYRVSFNGLLTETSVPRERFPALAVTKVY